LAFAGGEGQDVRRLGRRACETVCWRQHLGDRIAESIHFFVSDRGDKAYTRFAAIAVADGKTRKRKA
jgi:hypothetical protein